MTADDDEDKTMMSRTLTTHGHLMRTVLEGVSKDKVDEDEDDDARD